MCKFLANNTEEGDAPVVVGITALRVIQILQCNWHLAGRKGMVRVAVGTVVTAGDFLDVTTVGQSGLLV